LGRRASLPLRPRRDRAKGHERCASFCRSPSWWRCVFPPRVTRTTCLTCSVFAAEGVPAAAVTNAAAAAKAVAGVSRTAAASLRAVAAVAAAWTAGSLPAKRGTAVNRAARRSAHARVRTAPPAANHRAPRAVADAVTRVAAANPAAAVSPRAVAVRAAAAATTSAASTACALARAAADCSGSSTDSAAVAAATAAAAKCIGASGTMIRQCAKIRAIATATTLVPALAITAPRITIRITSVGPRKRRTMSAASVYRRST
jgi:hypothetical protein